MEIINTVCIVQSHLSSIINTPIDIPILCNDLYNITTPIKGLKEMPLIHSMPVCYTNTTEDIVKRIDALPAELSMLIYEYYNPYTVLYNDVVEDVKHPDIRIRDGRFKEYWYRDCPYRFRNDKYGLLTILRTDEDINDIVRWRVYDILIDAHTQYIYPYRKNKDLSMNEFNDQYENIITNEDLEIEEMNDTIALELIDFNEYYKDHVEEETMEALIEEHLGSYEGHDVIDGIEYQCWTS